jgi:RHS repeat-associated protein
MPVPPPRCPRWAPAASGTQSYSYDQNGNLLGAGSSVFSWDYANRLATAQVGSTTASYSYDGDGTRTSKTVNGTTTPYLWDRPASGGPLLASDGTNSYLSDTQGSLLGQLDSSNTPTYYLDDGLGSVRGTAGTAGTLAGSADYDVFGAARNTSGVQPGAGVGFTGQQTDAETGLQYLRAREYTPVVGRFLSADSVQPNAPGTQGYNLYTYVANNPATWVDPSGTFATSSIDVFLGSDAADAAVGADAAVAAEAIGEATCYATPWCAALIVASYLIYEKDTKGPMATPINLALAGLAWADDRAILALACVIDTVPEFDTPGDHCFYWPDATTRATPVGSTGPASGPPKKPVAPPPGGCQFQGPVPSISGARRLHILQYHAYHSSPRPIPNDGKFNWDEWGPIYFTIADASRNSQGRWQVDPADGGACLLEYNAGHPIGWDNPPPALGGDGNPTPCLRIVITNTPAGAVTTAYPINPARARLPGGCA